MSEEMAETVRAALEAEGIPAVRPDNRQAVFDYVCRKLAEQGRVSRSRVGGLCMYRLQADVGMLKCAAGHLIPDRLYADDMRGTAAMLLSRSVGYELFAADVDFVTALQRAHDSSHSDSMLRSALQQVASRYALDARAVDLITRWET